MSVTGQQLVAEALKQRGKPYVFGAEVSKNEANPKAFDCSELVEYVCGRLGIKMVDGAANQFAFCKGRKISLQYAKAMPGALVFVYTPKQKKITHVGFSCGDGTTMEARGKAYGCNVFKWRKSWTHACLIPGVEYDPNIKEV